MKPPQARVDLLPENDPPPQPKAHAAWWIAVVLAAAGATIFGMAWGGLDFWESLAGVVLGGVIAIWVMRWMSRRAARTPTKPADDASLRQEIHQWRRGKPQA